MPLWLEVGEHRRACAHLLEIVDGARHAHCSRDRDQVQHGVRAAEHRHDHHRILERLARHDVTRFQIEREQPPHGRSSVEAFLQLARILGRHR
jgi:hypothetical protein